MQSMYLFENQMFIQWYNIKSCRYTSVIAFNIAFNFYIYVITPHL